MKNYLLIGGSYGIGRALAEELARTGKVTIASRTWEGPLPENMAHIRFDSATDDLDLSLLPDTVDGFAYLPGSITLRPFKSCAATDFEDAMKINFHDMVRVLQKILPRLVASGAGSVVLFSTVAATQGMPFHTIVSAAKGAVEGFAIALAAELAPSVRVNVVAPSLTATALSQKFLDTPSKQERAAARHPMQRFGTPEDIASAAAFLMTGASGWVTGQVLRVDGGLSTLKTP